VRRREIIAGVGSLAVLGGGLYVATSDQTDETVDPVTVERLGEDGTPAGELRVPQRGQPTLLTVFATWCQTCRRTMPNVVAVREEFPETQFVSVSNEAVGQTTTREDVAEWWDTHGGDWPVGLDTDLDLTAAFDIRGVPHTITFDADNRIVADQRGRKSTEDLRDALESA
jgi:thiol-disulfide isomerase/thioredoxin